MATILAYTSPALGHLLPISALLSELSRRGHTVHVRTLSTGVEIGQRLGFTTDAIDPRIERIELDDWKATNPIASLKLSVAVFGRRAVHEVTDLAEAVAQVHPDALLIDVNCWGAQSAADAGPIPWACFSPYTPPLRSPGVPPFGLGLRPMSGAVGRMRDAAVRTAVVGAIEKGNAAADQHDSRRGQCRSGRVNGRVSAPVTAVARRQRQAIPVPGNRLGRCGADDRTLRARSRPNTAPAWLASIDRPIVLVTTSSEKQADDNLVRAAMTALADEPVHVVATVPAGQSDEVATSPNATVCRFVPHGVSPGPCGVCGDARWDGRDSKGARPWRTRVRRALRARPIRGRTARRGSPVRHPPTGQETVAGAAAHEGARSNDND